MPPSESRAENSKLFVTPALRLSFLLSQIVCYGWLSVLFMMWQMSGMNFLLQEAIGRLILVTTTIVTVFVAALYVWARVPSFGPRCIGYTIVAALLQLAVYFAISTHSITRFPMK
jgi:hypothetical protein